MNESERHMASCPASLGDRVAQQSRVKYDEDRTGRRERDGNL